MGAITSHLQSHTPKPASAVHVVTIPSLLWPYLTFHPNSGQYWQASPCSSFDNLYVIIDIKSSLSLLGEFLTLELRDQCFMGCDAYTGVSMGSQNGKQFAISWDEIHTWRFTFSQSHTSFPFHDSHWLLLKDYSSFLIIPAETRFHGKGSWTLMIPSPCYRHDFKVFTIFFIITRFVPDLPIETHTASMQTISVWLNGNENWNMSNHRRMTLHSYVCENWWTWLNDNSSSVQRFSILWYDL